MPAKYEGDTKTYKAINTAADELYNYLQVNARYRFKTRTGSEFEGYNAITLYAETKGSMKSSGEDIVLTFCVVNDETCVHISSTCKRATQMIDWGVNKANVERLIKVVQGKGPAYVYAPKRAAAGIGKKKEKPVLRSVSCTYCGGHENLVKETSGFIALYSDRLEFSVLRSQFAIRIEDITDSKISSYEQVKESKRRTAEAAKEPAGRNEGTGYAGIGRYTR